MKFTLTDDIKTYINKRGEHKEYIEDPKDYFTKNGVWTNWYDFLCIDTSNIIKTKTEWIEFCKSINVISIEDYFEKCKKYIQLPMMPEELIFGYIGIRDDLGLIKNRNRKS